MMSLVRILVFTIISSLVSLDGVESGVNDDFVLEEYFLYWRQMGELVSHKDKTEKMKCETFEVKKSFLCDACIEEVYVNWPDDGKNSPKRKGYGSVLSSNILVMSYPFLRKPEIRYNVEKFSNGDQLILRDDRNMRNTKLLSRNYTISSETRIRFEDIAITNKVYAIYADPKDCAPLSDD